MPPVSSPGLGTPAGQRSRPGRDAALARVRFRRAVTLLLMTLVLPGSAQLAAGRRDIGRLALRIWLSLLGAVAFVVLVGMMWHGFIYWLASNTVVLGFVRLLLCALAVGWALLFIDAWRLGQPLQLLQKQRLAIVGLNGVLCFAVAGSLLFASHVVAVQKGFISAMFGDGTATVGPRRPLQRAAARRRLRQGPLGTAARQHHGREHRRRHRQDDPVRPAAQHDELPVRRGLGDGRAVPRHLRLRRLRAEQPVHLGRRPQGPVQGLRQPRCRGDHGGGRGHHRAARSTTTRWSTCRASAAWCRHWAGSSSTCATGSRSAASAGRSPATSSRACSGSTATRRCGSHARARAPTTTRGWRGRSAS